MRAPGGPAGRLLREDSGQVLPMVTIMLVVLLGLVGLTLDVGRAYYAQRELQASTDAAALAAAQAMLLPASTTATIVGTDGTGGLAEAYSSASAATSPKVIAAGANQRSTLPQTTEFATLKCLASLQAQGEPCVGNVPYNAVQVQQTSVLPTVIAWMFGKKTLTINALSTASSRGGTPKPSNIAVILDTSLSEDALDTNCHDANGNTLTEMQCSLNGLQVLLSALQPCGSNVSNCAPSANGTTPASFDRVALFTFPNVTPATVQIDTSCTTAVPTPTPQNNYYSGNVSGTNINYTLSFAFTGGAQAVSVAPWGGLPTAAGYTFPAVGASSYAPSLTALGNYNPQTSQITYGLATYQVTDYLNDYRLSNSSSTLNPSSPLVIAAGAAGCRGMAPSNWDGMYGTYYAGVIYAAQASLVAEQAANPGSQNVIILISDGDATSGQTQQGANLVPSPYFDGFFPAMPPSNVPNPATASGTYPSWVQECSQAVTAAQYATSAGTTVFTVAYGSEPVGCLTDIAPHISPCDTMANMASAPQFFYSDYLQSGSNSTCYASQPVTSIAQIFASIANDITEARLIPNNTT